MSRHRSWLASVTRLALAGAIVLALGLIATSRLVSAQDTWWKAYLDGESAFKNHDYTTAEAKLRDSIARAPKGQSHGPKAVLVSQQRGFIPEYYLAIICADSGRAADALEFVGQAKYYLTDKTQVDALAAAEKKAKNALAAAQPPAPAAGAGDTGRSNPPPSTPAKPPVDPYAEVIASLRSELNAGKLDEAIRDRNQARVGGAKGDAFDAVSRAIDQKDFDRAMATADQALKEKKFADAMTAAEHARGLFVDPGKVISLESEITRLADAAKAVVPAPDRGKAAPPPPTAPPRPPAPSAAVLDAQRRGLRAFLSGDYQDAMLALRPVALDANGARARFYLACAEAGLALLEPDAAKRANLESEAKRDWQAVAVNRASFSADFTFVSPAIMRTLGIADR